MLSEDLIKQKKQIEKELAQLELVDEDDFEFESIAEELMYEECEDSIEAFFLQSWQYIAQGEYYDNWFIPAICEHLEALYTLDIQRLIISIAPRHAKSSLCSQIFPVWLWIKDPSIQIISASYSSFVSMRDTSKSRDLINTDFFQKRWGQKVKLKADTNRKDYYKTTFNGHRLATSVGGTVTGISADLICIDDPHKAKDGSSQARKDEVKNFYDSTISNRWNHPSTFRQLVIHQRVAEDDLTGYLLDSQPGEWEHLKLPIEYIPSVYVTKIGWKDPRTKEGEILCPEIMPEDAIAREKKKGDFHWFPQYQQEPVSPDGGYVKKTQIKYYAFLPDTYDLILTSWDLTFGQSDIDKRGSAWNVGQVWLKNRGDRYAVHQVRFKGGINEQLREIRKVCNDYPEARIHLIENKANGTAVMDSLRRDIPGLVPIEPREFGGDKESRLIACLPEINSGNVWFPEVSLTNKWWVKDLETELFLFPRAKTKDCVDTLSQALNYLALKCQTQSALIPNTITETPFSYFNQTVENNYYVQINNTNPNTTNIRSLFGV